MERAKSDAATLRPIGTPLPDLSGPSPVSDAASLQQILALRDLIWRNEPDLVDTQNLGIDARVLRDAHDGHGLHWVIRAGDAIVAAARLCLHGGACDLPGAHLYQHLHLELPTPIASLNKMVVHPSMRRRGLSRALTEVRVAAARENGARVLIVDAAPNRVPPLLELGFQVRGLVAKEQWARVDFTVLTLTL